MLAPETGKRSPNTQKDWRERAEGGGGIPISFLFSVFLCPSPQAIHGGGDGGRCFQEPETMRKAKLPL